MLVSSHLLSEMDQMADYVGIINHGQLIFQDRLEVLQPGATRAMTAPRFRRADTSEELETYGVAGTLLEMRFPFPVGVGDLIRGVTRNHRQ